VAVAIVKGEVNGGIQASQRIEAYPPARIIGDIQAPVVAIESGVTFEGKCNMGQAAGATSTAKAPQPAESEEE
jgi:cytoskeletal protein CcmA (bactofilin family)